MKPGVTRLILGATLLALTALPANAAGAKIHIIDGDTIQIGEQKIRLHGIDAPESGQQCIGIDLTHWDCGQAATQVLGNIIGKRGIKCVAKGADRYGRIVAECFVPGDSVSINERMVQGGAAWAYRRYSMQYVPAENRARHRRIGIWKAPNTPPWEYRNSRN
ncbi:MULTISPECIES: thermonuclease family protein [unclassified Pannonibacter]|uniref:thermonuclease family protein n=1 Tax=unclassified Pannonibacter TaxID=2627228 RepID=UPI001644151B|nr:MULTISPECIES: thermonuclease family protein [unclassified Pannonibacter]